MYLQVSDVYFYDTTKGFYLDVGMNPTYGRYNFHCQKQSTEKKIKSFNRHLCAVAFQNLVDYGSPQLHIPFYVLARFLFLLSPLKHCSTKHLHKFFYVGYSPISSDHLASNTLCECQILQSLYSHYVAQKVFSEFYIYSLTKPTSFSHVASAFKRFFLRSDTNGGISGRHIEERGLGKFGQIILM